MSVNCGCNTSISTGSCGCKSLINPCLEVQYCQTSACKTTLNADCVFYNKERLSFESNLVQDNSSRTLTSILQKIGATRQKYPSTVLFFSTQTSVYTRTLGTEHLGKTILLNAEDEGFSGTTVLTFTINLPTSIDFMDEEILLKDISLPTNQSTTTYNFVFSSPIITDYNPLTQTTSFATLSTNNVLRLRFVQNQYGTYTWMRV